MKIYLAGENQKNYILNTYLAGEHTVKNGKDLIGINKKVNLLETFYYFRSNKNKDLVLKMSEDLLLDSGAFTFMSGTKNSLIDWDAYIEEYISFINKNSINLFFELDLDSIIGLAKVESFRKKIEKGTLKKCIPVWHKYRGLNYWKKITKEYDYVAIGGIVSGEIKKNEYDIFTNLINIANNNNCKVHALGFTNAKGLRKYKFYSVDSTAWLYGNRGGFLYHFNGKSIVKIDKPLGTRLKSKEVAMHNFTEWVKFQRYAKNNL